MLTSSPFEASLSQSSHLYHEDNQLHITLVFGLLTDFWHRPIYDHAALVCEHYDVEQQKISVSLYHLSTRDDWTANDVIRHCGYSLRDYHVRKETSDVIVERMMCHPKYKSPYARYEPYKTFRIKKTEKTMAVLANLDALSSAERYPYSMYGARATNAGVQNGNHNCISFVADVLWQLGIFKPTYSLRDILRYSHTYAAEGLSPYARFHFMTKRFIYTPEALKHLIDNSHMRSLDHVYLAHQVATTETRRSERHNGAYFVINTELKRNIVKAFEIKYDEKYEKSNAKDGGSSFSRAFDDEENEIQSALIQSNIDGNIKATRLGYVALRQAYSRWNILRFLR
ncbi:MAG: hypothetical protein V4482_06945 [Pseudomonadota bacterium]